MFNGPFQNKQFRRLFSGRVVTNMGDSLYFVAAMWLVHELTSDPFYTGLAGFLTMLPGAFQFLVGPLVDRWSIRRTLLGTQALQAVLVLSIPLAAAYNALTVELVLVVMPVLATLNEVANPAMVTALPRLVDDEELVAANSVISIARKAADMVGNGASGLLLGLVGVGALFVVNSVVFLVSAALFATLIIPSTSDRGEVDGAGSSERSGDSESVATSDGGTVPEAEELSYLDELRSGFEYVHGTTLTWLVVGAAGLNFTSGAIIAAMPAYAETLSVPALLDAFGGAGAYGILMGSFTAGNFLGAIGANVIGERPLGSTLILGSGAAGLCWVGSILLSWLPATATLFLLAFVPVGVINIHLASLIQSAPPDEMVGRITSLYSSISNGVVPVGSLLGGALAGSLGVRTVMFVVGVGFFGMAAYVLSLPGLRGLPQVDEISI